MHCQGLGAQHLELRQFSEMFPTKPVRSGFRNLGKILLFWEQQPAADISAKTVQLPVLMLHL